MGVFDRANGRRFAECRFIVSMRGQGPAFSVFFEKERETHFSPLTSDDWHALDTDTIAKLPKEELPQDTEARPASVYQPMTKSQKLKAMTGTTFVITPGLGQEYALRFRYKNTTGQPVSAKMTITDSKNAVLVDTDVTFPPTPNKFKMLSTTTGTQINAGTYTVNIDTQDIEFKELEIQ